MTQGMAQGRRAPPLLGETRQGGAACINAGDEVLWDIALYAGRDSMCLLERYRESTHGRLLLCSRVHIEAICYGNYTTVA